MNKQYVVAIDVGGTKTLVALVRAEDGMVLTEHIRPTNVASSEEFIAEIVKGINTVHVSGIRPGAIGIGTAGHVDEKAGTLTSMNLNAKELPLKRLIESATNLPVYLDNDANAGALGEQQYGAARGRRHFAFISVGTGVGVGLVLNGDVYRGKSNYAGEIGHVGIDVAGMECKCGGRGCLENIASGSAIASLARKRLALGCQSQMRDPYEADRNTITCETVFAAVRQKDELAREIVEEAAQGLGYTIRNLKNLLDLDMIVLGGGVVAAAPPLFIETIQKHALIENEVNPEELAITLSKLGTNAVVLGAAALTRGRLARQEVS